MSSREKPRQPPLHHPPPMPYDHNAPYADRDIDTDPESQFRRARYPSSGSGHGMSGPSASGAPRRHHHHQQPQQHQRHQQQQPRRSTSGGMIAVKPAGESGRRGFHPIKFLKITLRSASWVSMSVNVLWPVVPAALVVRYLHPEAHLAIFILSYIAMVPCANLVGFAGQELARKFSHVFGVLTEVTLGSVVEIIMFHVLLKKGEMMFPVIRAAILGSILATMLLCLGLVFFVGGMRHDEQSFNEAVSEAGNGLLLTAGLALTIPTAYDQSVTAFAEIELDHNVLDISRIVAVLLIVAYLVFTFFQARTHHGIYDAIFEADEAADRDGHRDRTRPKLTLTECIIALVIAIALVTILAITLVEEIGPIVSTHNISDPFMGLILVPLVEKAAEHLTAIDEAWDDQMNFAMSHVLGATLQTAMFNGPLVVISAWGLGLNMNLSFETFEIIVLILSIITVGNFLRDQKSNYLEGFLCVIVYLAIAVAAWWFPSSEEIEHAEKAQEAGEESSAAAEAVERLVRMVKW